MSSERMRKPAIVRQLFVEKEDSSDLWDRASDKRNFIYIFMSLYSSNALIYINMQVKHSSLLPSWRGPASSKNGMLRIRARRQLLSTLCLSEPVCNSKKLRASSCTDNLHCASASQSSKVKNDNRYNPVEVSLRKAQGIFSSTRFSVSRLLRRNKLHRRDVPFHIEGQWRHTNMIIDERSRVILRASVNIPICPLLFWSVRTEEMETPRAFW
jgi:hypothetical protein